MTIVTLCGSTRFKDAFSRAQFDETMKGNIVLTIGTAWHSDEELFANYSEAERQEIKQKLDALHFEKIEMSDEILVLNIGGYVGESTKREINHAWKLDKHIRWLEEPTKLCPYAGCESPYTKFPPCVLCYE